MRRFEKYNNAKKFLELRKRHAYRKIEKKGDVVVRDCSFVGWDFADIVRPVEDRGRYVAYLLIWTKNMIEDIKNLQSPDVLIEELKLLIKFDDIFKKFENEQRGSIGKGQADQGCFENRG
jgi:hypothetical protein